MIHLQTERLVLRDPLPSDLPDWHRLLSDRKTMYYLDDIMTHSLEESRENLDVALSEANSPNRKKVFFAMELKHTAAFVGTIGYTVTETTPVGKIVGAGYFILPEHFGNGYTPEALKELMRFAFEEDGVFRFNTGCMADNKPSERVMRKCGMIKEGEFKAYTWHDGKMKDRLAYRLLKSEWEELTLS